ncbi:OmpA family protein [Adhaeribacter arboris]|uniref:OmpA family protein n=1 Tax=Adhaeribacter arboris TaxID=2072846 RepID=A0A2T2YEB7_9BACT|nr:OmpA family protein [Adhaeribacter arboris]PSR53856.1 OmpA family protein [Adhaeribacter arboris]
MAELNVQPKSKRPWWLWLLLALLALALLFFLLRGCNRDQATAPTDTGAAADSTAMAGDTTSEFDWNTVDFGAPAATYDEITDADINVRGNDDYAIYSLDETILFDTDKNTIKPSAAEKLKQVAASMGKRFANGQVRIYGHTDAKGSAGYNMQLAEQRAEAVRNWLTQNGNITADQVSLHPVGEAQPVASNATAEGRQQNRRVEIVVRRGA